MARAGLASSWQCLFANDNDQKKCAAYRSNWGSAEIFEGDVAGVSVLDLPGHADLVWASFPCQDLSLAGNGAGLDGGRSGAFWPFWRIMRQLKNDGRQPRTIVLENVCGLLTSRGGSDFIELCRAVGNEGYRFGAIVIDAAHFLPQSRPRLFVIATQHDCQNLRSISDEPTQRWHPQSLLDAYRKMPDPLKSAWRWFTPRQTPLRKMSLADIIEDNPFDTPWHDEEVTNRLLAMMSQKNRAKVVEAQLSNNRVVGTVYKRTRIEAGHRVQRAEVRFDNIAGCLRTPGGGSSRQTVLIVDQARIRSRLISARETARLMGLPDSYHLPRNYNDAYHLTGDGVAVPVVRFIAEQIIEPFFASHALAAATD